MQTMMSTGMMDNYQQPGQTSGSLKEKKKSRRKWMKKLRNELRMPGAAPQTPGSIPAPKMPIPQSASEPEWSNQSALISK
ncbi:hypothetical protein [Paenibacillus campi]|uniref:hypothetical protein n=1 Tax=Paenibacillus campi TaxID=3106031 RepID=UPI002AFF2520|nr:hypothetical protein [Paenibacillus sp. SGZ-1009]